VTDVLAEGYRSTTLGEPAWLEVCSRVSITLMTVDKAFIQSVSVGGE